MLMTLLSFSPLILVTLFAIFAVVLVVDDAKRSSKEAQIENELKKPRTINWFEC
jgi:uncharacterized BrkB/YihY/UPF0761 family membrane protein